MQPNDPVSSVLSEGQTITLYAIWENIFTVKYDANGGTGATANQTTVAGKSITIKSASTFTPADHKQFKNWNTAADGSGTTYAAGSTFTPATISYGEEITLYAQWDDVWIMKFINTADNSTKTKNVIRGQSTKVAPETDFNRDNYAIKGWDTVTNDGSNNAGTVVYQYDQTIVPTDDMDFYTVWTTGTMLDTGTNVNEKLKRLAGNDGATFSTIDTNIQSIQRITTLPAGSLTTCDSNTVESNSVKIISNSASSAHPICAYYDSGVIYYYTDADIIYANSTSSSMFYEFRALSSAPGISGWNISKVMNMDSMFYNAGYNATPTFSLDLSNWDTSRVTTMEKMFISTGYSATTWSIGGLSNWDTSRVTSMKNMFQSAGYSATPTFSLDLSGWNTSKVTTMYQMFTSTGYKATTFSLIGLSNWDTSKVTIMSSMFSNAGYSAASWSIGDLSGWDTSKVTNMGSMFYYAGYSATTFSLIGLSDWDTSQVTNMDSMFCYAGYSATTTWSVGDLSGWDTSQVTNMSSMFDYAGYNATTWSIGDLSGWDTSKVTSMTSMFSSAGRSATTWSIGDLSNWDTSRVTSMNATFANAGRSATTFSLDLSGWNTSQVTNMGNMFVNAGYNATTWSVIIPQTNGNGINNTTSRIYGKTTSTYYGPPSGRSFTLAQ